MIQALIDREPSLWTRRAWVTRNTVAALMTAGGERFRVPRLIQDRIQPRQEGEQHSTQSGVVAFEDWEALAQRAVDAAKRAGAQYADAHLTRTTSQGYSCFETPIFTGELLKTGVGVRVLVNGYWGFAAFPSGSPAAIDQLARDAVTQATMNGRGPKRTVELGEAPVTVGKWTTPVTIDPFTVPMEEKLAFLRYWIMTAQDFGLGFVLPSHLIFTKTDRVVATSDGSHFSQTLIESGGRLDVQIGGIFGSLIKDSPLAQFIRGAGIVLNLLGLDPIGRGWEVCLDANIPEQLRTLGVRLEETAVLLKSARPMTIGRYTLVCDGATMAAMVEATLGMATQLDRALGYEANASGTSFLNDPLTMLGAFKAASPLVTVTANRSAPAQLATVKWDDEGIAPTETTLIKDGVLNDFQTTREQSGWLAPYYTKAGHPLRSNGHASSEDALAITMQQMPNLALQPNVAQVTVDDLVANVKDGILIENGAIAMGQNSRVSDVDFQGRTGLLMGRMRQIKNGRPGALLNGGAIQFDALDFWRHVVAIGGASTVGTVGYTQYSGYWLEESKLGGKGEPPQSTSHSVQAVAATITDQAILDPSRRV